MNGSNAKYDYESVEFSKIIEDLARKGLTNKEIALSIGLSEKHFSVKVNELPNLSNLLSRTRASINAAVRAKFLSVALGGGKVKTITTQQMRIDGELTENATVNTVEAELAPNLNALTTWLYHHDEEWREKTVNKVDVTSNGQSLVPEKINLEIVYNKKEDTELKEN